MWGNVTAVIPAYNEEASIFQTVKAVKEIEHITEIIVVDDGSKDNTYKIAKGIENIILLRNETNQGKGKAIKSALPLVSNKYVIFIDADLKQSAKELQKLVSNTKRKSRNMLVALYPKAQTKGGFGLVKGLSQKGLYLLTSKTSNSVLSGQRLMSTEFIRKIKIPDNFGMEFKITLEALKNNIEIIEVPVNIRHRETGRDIKGFLHRGKQFTNILSVLIKEIF